MTMTARDDRLQQIAICLVEMSTAIRRRRYMVAGLMFAEAVEATHSIDARACLSIADRQRARILADALWEAGEQLMAHEMKKVGA